MNKAKKNEIIEKAELIEDPTIRSGELKRITQEMLNLPEMEKALKSKLESIERLLAKETYHDKLITKPDTVDCIKRHFDRMIKEFHPLSQSNSNVREKLYFLTLNASILVYEYINKMRRNNYSIHGVKYLYWTITMIESDIILSGLKYLKWRVKLYSELALSYEDHNSFKSAYKVILQATNKILELKSLEEQQGPLPDNLRVIIFENLRVLKILEMKYGFLSGLYTVDLWKKKLDEAFPNINDRANKILCGINSFCTFSKNCSIVFHEGLKISGKSQAVAYFYELIKSDLITIKTGIIDHIDKSKRDIEKNEKIKANFKDYQAVLDEHIEKDSKINTKWRAIAKNIPIEIHGELLKAAFDCRMWKEFIELLESLKIRILYRSVEVPYISDIDIQVSSSPNANIPNKYEKIKIDLNVNNFYREIRKLREKGKVIGMPISVDKTEEMNKNKQQAATKKKAGNIDDTQIKSIAQINPNEKVEGIDHTYIYLLLRKSHNLDKAVINTRIVISNDYKISSMIEADEKAFAIPIRTYKNNLYEEEDNNYENITHKIKSENNRFIPYLVYKKTSSSLQNQEEKLSALVDLFPLVTNSYHADPPLNFKKNETELTIERNQQAFHNNPVNCSHFYVNICQKTDEMFHIIQRESEILKNLYELETTFTDMNSTDFKSFSQTDKFLSLNFNIEKLEMLSTTLNQSIVGPLGNFFLSERKNFIYEICVLLWKKYLKEFLTRIDYFYTFEAELEETEKFEISEKIFKIEKFVFSSLYNLHHVLSSITNKDPIMFAFLTKRFADFCEKKENISIGVEVVKSCLDYIQNYKEETNRFGMKNKDNKHTFTTFTCDNVKISNLYKNLQTKCEEYMNELNCKRRKNFRREYILGFLTAEEQIEEDFEFDKLEKEYEERMAQKFKKNLDKLIINPQEINENQRIKLLLTENENTLNCLYVDLLVKYFRMYLKLGFSESNSSNFLGENGGNQIISPVTGTRSLSSTKINNKTHNNRSKSSNKTNKIADKTLKKVEMIKGPTASNVKSNMATLKVALQEAGKLDPDKPVIHRHEKNMLGIISENIYMKTLFNMTLAAFRLNKMDQKFLFNQSSNLLNECFIEEDSRQKYYENYFFYIMSYYNYNKNKDINSSTYYPFNLLYKDFMIDLCDKIPEPILIHKTEQTATFIFPVVKVKNEVLNGSYKTTNKVALFGQQSTGTNIVSLNNNKLFGTGSIQSAMDYVTVRNMKPNEKYIFAYAGYDTDDTLINGVGKTSKEVQSYFPLPKFLIAYHVAKMAFDYHQYEVCKENTKMVFDYFTEKSELRDISLDNKSDCLLYLKLKYDSVKLTCFLELEGVAYSFLYYSKCLRLLKSNDNSDKLGVNIIQKQKNLLKNLNVLMLGLEIATYIRHFSLIKLFVNEAYSILSIFTKQKNLYSNIFQLLVRINLAISIIPNELWDFNLRTASSLISYQIMQMSLNCGEFEFYKKILSHEVFLNKKKFYLFRYKYLKKVEVDNKKIKFSLASQQPEQLVGKKEANPNPNNNNNITKPQLVSGDNEESKCIEVDAVILNDLEKETQELDELLLYTSEYNDILKIKISNYFINLDKFCLNFSKIAEINIEIEKKKKEMSEVVEVWEGFKSEGLKYIQKFSISQRDLNERYYEFTSKMLKKLIENNYISLNTTQYSAANPPVNKNNPIASSVNNYTATILELLKVSDDIAIKDSDMANIANIYLQKLNYVSNDIIYAMKMRIKEFLDKIEAEIKKQNEKMQNYVRVKTEEKEENDFNLDNINLNQNINRVNSNTPEVNLNLNLNLDLVAININLEKIRADIEEKCFGSQVENENRIPYDSFSINEIYAMKEKFFWLGDLMFNKAIVLFLEYLQTHRSLLNFSFNNFLNNYKLVDLKKIQNFKEEYLSSTNLTNLSSIPNSENKKLTEQRNVNNNQLVLEKNFDLRYKRLSKIFEKLSLSSLFFNEVNSWVSFDNLLYLAYNLLLYDMLLPMDAIKENIWTYLNVIAEIATKRLDKIKNGEGDYKPTDYEREIQSLKARLQDKQSIKTGMNFKMMKSSNSNALFTNKDDKQMESSLIDEEKLIAEYEAKINFDVYVEFILFCIQCNYHAGKWNVLSNLIQNFNLITLDLFAEFTLPFLIEAQNKIYNKALENLKGKQTEINHRVAEFETWKNSRKKNKRQQMITGEIPQEQKDFEKDHYVLSKELYILDSITNLLRTDKEKSEKQYQNLINDANNCHKAINNCRKLFETYKIEIYNLSKEDAIGLVNPSEPLLKKKKYIQTLANNLINSYKKSIHMLKKRQENYLLIQALYEMSIVYNSESDLKNSEVYLNEGLDTVFQKLYVVKDFRGLFETLKGGLVEKYGIRELFYAVKILHKLAKFCYDNNLHMQRECAIMSGDIIHHILSCYLPNPSSILNYSHYRLNEINKNTDVFKSSENVNADDLLNSLIDLAEILIPYGEYERCLPILTVAEHIACDILKNTNILHKSRAIKIICLAHLGLISEAMQIFYKIVKKFDLPCFILNSLQIEKTNGRFANLTKEFKYFNNLTPENPKNVDALNSFSKLQIDNELKFQMGCSLYSRLVYAKCLIVYKIYEKENYLNYLEKSDSRLENLQKLEKELRDALQIVANSEELNSLSFLNQLVSSNNSSGKVLNQNSISDWNLNPDVINKKIEEIVTKNKISSDEMNLFYLNKLNKDHTELRKERIDLICELRILLSKIAYSQGLYSASSSILIKCLENLKMFSQNYFIGIETCEDYPMDFKSLQAQSSTAKGKNTSQSDFKKIPVNDKKPNNTNQTLLSQQQNINLTEEINKFISKLNEVNSMTRTYANPIIWLLINNLNLLNLFKMSRQQDCLGLIKKLLTSTNVLNDFYFTMRYKEIEIMINLLNYNISEAERSFKDVSEIGRINNLIDYEFSIFLTNYSEFFYNQNKSKDAINLIKEARKIIWLKMARINYSIKAQSYVESNLTKNLEIDKNLKNILKEKEASVLASQPGLKKIGGGLSADGISRKKDDKTIEGNMGVDFNQLIPVDFNKKVDEFFEKISKDSNDSDEGANLYFKYTDIICKIDLKFVLYQLVSSSSNYFNPISFTSDLVERIQFESIQSVLLDLEIINERLLYPHNSFKIILYYLFGKMYKTKFISDLSDFISEKMAIAAKKENIEILTNKEVLAKFSNYYNITCSQTWVSLLTKSREYFEKSLSYTKGEFYVCEDGFSYDKLLLDLSEVNMLSAQFRPLLTPKYADLNQIVNKISALIKTNKFYEDHTENLPNLNEIEESLKIERNTWLDDKDKNERILCRNFIRNSIYYAELANKVLTTRKLLNDNIFEIANGTLIDHSKLPRDITNQILEMDYLYKKRNKMYLNPANISIKSSCDSFDVLNLLKNLTREVEFFTLNNEEGVKNISKLHKFLKLNLTNYMTKCNLEILPAVFVPDLNSELMKKDQIVIYYQMNKIDLIDPDPFKSNLSHDKNSQNLNLIYIVGASSVESQFKEIVYGRISGSKNKIMSINRKLIELRTSLRNSLSSSEQKKKRDLKYFNKDYLDVISEFCEFFLKVKKIYQDASFITNVLRKDLLGEISLENLDFFINLTSMNSYVTVNPKLNAFIYDLHMKLNQ